MPTEFTLYPAGEQPGGLLEVRELLLAEEDKREQREQGLVQNCGSVEQPSPG